MDINNYRSHSGPSCLLVLSFNDRSYSILISIELTDHTPDANFSLSTSSNKEGGKVI